MSLLKLKARVCVPSEDQMEAEGKYDMGNVARGKEWVWANIAVLATEVYKIISYKKEKTIVIMYNDENILVAERFNTVYAKWEEALEEPETIEFEPDDEHEEAESEEEDDDE